MPVTKVRTKRYIKTSTKSRRYPQPSRFHSSSTALTFTPTNPLTNLPVISYEESVHVLTAAKISYTHHYMKLGHLVYHSLATSCGIALHQMNVIGEEGDWKGVLERLDLQLQFKWMIGLLV